MPSADFTVPCQNLVGQKIDHDRLQFVKELGSGAYGVVYQAKDLTVKTRDHFYAVKCLNNLNLDARQRKFQKRELALHTLASSHPSVVSLLKVIETREIVYVILEFVPGGDLFGLITEQQKYIGNDALVSKVFLQICDAVAHCHELGIFHRDLKPENVLCSANGEEVKIADFGLATSEKYSTDFGCGSSFYMSPEIHGGLDAPVAAYYTAPNDIWSLGIILVNLICCRNPWRQATMSDETFLAFLYDPNFLRTILPISKECNEVLQAVFHPDARERVNIQELRAMVGRASRWTMGEEELLTTTKAAREAGVTSGLPAALKAKARLQAREKAKDDEKRLRELHHRLINSPHATPRPALAHLATPATAPRKSPKIAPLAFTPVPGSPRPHFAQPVPPSPRPHYATPASPSIMSSNSVEPYPAFTVSPATPRQHYVPSPYPSNSGSHADNERSVTGHSTSSSNQFSLDSSYNTRRRNGACSSSSSIAVGLHALANPAASTPNATTSVIVIPALSSDSDSDSGSSPASSAPATPQVYASDAAHLAAAGSSRKGGGGGGGRSEDVLDLELDSLRVVNI